MQLKNTVLIPVFGLNNSSMELLEKKFKSFIRNLQVQSLSIMDSLNIHDLIDQTSNIDICVLHSMAALLLVYQNAKPIFNVKRIKNILLLDPTVNCNRFSKLLKSLTDTQLFIHSIEKKLSYLSKMQKNTTRYKYLDHKQFAEKSFIYYLQWVKTYAFSAVLKSSNECKISFSTSTKICKNQLENILDNEKVILSCSDVESHNSFISHPKLLAETIFNLYS